MFQYSAQRFSGAEFAPPIVVTGSDYRFIAIQQLSDIGIATGDVIIEPISRNTAPAILAAALILHASDPQALMLAVPSDHVIPDSEAFRTAVIAARTTSQDGDLVTFGIQPNRADTSYGWLEMFHKQRNFDSITQPLCSFVEKPDLPAAKKMLNEGRYLWNSGVFLMRVDVLISAFTIHAPTMLRLVQKAVDRSVCDLGFTQLESRVWSKIEGQSIDYVIMEKADNLSVLSYTGAWSDVGDWASVHRNSDTNTRGVATSGAAVAYDCDDVLLRAESEHQNLVAIGVKNIIAVSMTDSVLIAHKDCAYKIKDVVTNLTSLGIVQAEKLPRNYRPWGWFECLSTGSQFQVKQIVINSGAALSLQSHMYRAEHWIIVEGKAKVTIGDSQELVSEGESVYIPIGKKHRIENFSKLQVILIEIQIGIYLGEDDITHYKDMYSRG